MAESTEARVQALIEQIRIFARLRIQETKTAASEDFRATEQHFDKLESALRAELGKDAERLEPNVNMLITDARKLQWMANRLKSGNPLSETEVREIAYSVEKSAREIFDVKDAE